MCFRGDATRIFNEVGAWRVGGRHCGREARFRVHKFRANFVNLAGIIFAFGNYLRCWHGQESS